MFWIFAALQQVTTPIEINFVPAAIAGIAGTVISLCFSYIPGLRVKYAALGEEVKRLIMAGVMLLVTAVIFILGCYGYLIVIGVTCDDAGILQAAITFIAAVEANQTVYKLTPQLPDTRTAKAKAKL